MLIFSFLAVGGYFLGSVPNGYLAGRIAGVDIRTLGSGNIGATNVLRTLGKRFGYPVFILDFAKGLAAVLIATAIVKSSPATSAKEIDFSVAVAGIASVIGHSYPVWLGFRGGKGVATSLGILFGIEWVAAIIVCAVWLIVFQISRYVSLASIAAAIALPLAMTGMLFLNRLSSPVFVYFAIGLAAIIVLRHRSNVSRLFNGTEPRFARK